MILGLIFAVAGLIVLAFAADHFVAGAARLAVFYDVSPVVIGAVLIGFGTSAPCLLYTSPSPRDMRRSRMPSSA